MTKVKLVEALRAVELATEEATAEDLEDIRGRLAELDQQRRMLAAAEKRLKDRLEPPEVMQASAAEVQAAGREPKEEIYDYLAAHGPSTASQIAAACGLTSRGAGMICRRCNWFRRDSYKRWEIAKVKPT
jgi:regulator of replication initiation timing